MNRRNRQPTDYEKRIRLLGYLGFVPGQKADDRAKGRIKGLLIWVYGLVHYKGRSPLQIPTRRVAQFIQFCSDVRLTTEQSRDLGFSQVGR